MIKEIKEIKKYDIWSEGYCLNGERSEAWLEGTYEGESFLDACKQMVKDKKYENLYNEQYNSIWGCKLYDNEADARRSFG